MAHSLSELTTEALALDPADRLRLASVLIDSVEGAIDPAWADLWTAEIARRSATADDREARGQARGSEWSDVKARLLASLSEQ